MQNLREFIFREAGEKADLRLSLLRHLAPNIRIQRGYDFNEFYELDHSEIVRDGASEDVDMTRSFPEDSEMLLCITARPFSTVGYTDSPYSLAREFALSLREWMARPAAGVDFEGPISHAYIQDQHLKDWSAHADTWREKMAEAITPVLRVGLQKQQGLVWTPERIAEATAFREQYGLKKTAEHYKVSQTTISNHIPAQKPRKKSVGLWPGLSNK